MFNELLKLKNISKIIFDFEIKPVLCLLDYYEQQEEYEECQLLKKRIETHNILTRNKYQTHL